MKLRALVGGLVVVAACGGGDGQRFRDAVGVLCASDDEAGVARLAPAERQAAKSAWIAARLQHAEVREVFRRMPELAPAERRRVLGELAARAGLPGCAAIAEPEFAASVDLADVAGAGVVPADELAGLTVVATAREIVVEGEAVLPLIDGEVAAAEKAATGDVEIPRLRAYVRATLDARPPAPVTPPMLVLMPRRATYRLLYEILSSSKRAGIRQFGLAARRDGALVAVPLTLSEMVRAPESSAQLIVAVTKEQILLFSATGQEGMVAEPRLATAGTGPDDVARLHAALLEIVARRPDDRRLIAMFDAEAPMQTVLGVLASVRARADGTPLFGDVLLSTGFR